MSQRPGAHGYAPAGAHRVYSSSHPGAPDCGGYLHKPATDGDYVGERFSRASWNWQSAPREGDEHSVVGEDEFSAPTSGLVEGLPMLIDELLYEMKNAESGPVTREQALGVASVLKGRNIICSLATLPLRQVDPAQSEVDSPFLRQLDPNVARSEEHTSELQSREKL